MSMQRRNFLKGITALGAAALPVLGSAVLAGEGEARAAQPDTWQVLSFKYAGPLTSSGALLTYMKDWDKTAERNFYFWALRSKGETVVVDCGVRPALAAERKLAGYASPEEMLARAGIQAAEVRHLVLTHAHFDHVGGLALFPNATVYIQRREFDFWVYDALARRPSFASLADPVAVAQLGELKGSGRLQLLDGDQQILPGVELLSMPGHTPGMQAVAVQARKGLAVVASDCAHLRANFEADIPSCLFTDLPAMLTSMTRLRQKAGGDLARLFPGHDPKLLSDYPRLAQDVTILA